MADVQVDSTRVFVKGLPPSITSDQLAVHFGKQYKVTDAHVFPERRIGFVGFDDSESAQHAVDYFNRSYIRMSKISVDLAKPIEVKRDVSGQAVPLSKRNASYPANDRRLRNETTQKPSSRDLNKRKRDERDDGEFERAAGGSDGQILESHGTNETISGAAQEQEVEADDDSKGLETAPAASDSDWLRGKTSRTLDLVEPEDTTSSSPVKDEKAQSESDSKEEQLPDHHEEDGVNQEDTKPQKVPNGRLFVRNLAFDVTDSDLEHRFGQFGKLQEAHVVKDARKLSSKGLAFIQFAQPEEAETALSCLDGVSFHGRLLHILPASDKRDQGLTDFDISKMPLKKQKAIKRKMEAASTTFSWNSLYMNPDAVIASIADRLGVSKSAILDPTSADAAVKQAHAETQLIAETKEYLRKHGVSMEAFKNKKRDDRIILLKNFAYGTSERELRDLLEPLGQISKFIFPPAGTMALAQYAEPYAATQALKQLAYKNIKGSVLYLEKAPQGLLDESVVDQVEDETKATDNHLSDQAPDTGDATTVFVRNLNFSTTTDRLKEVFGRLAGFLSARVKTRIDPKRPNEILSMGYGFVEFKNKGSADAAVATLNGYKLDSHELIVKLSTKTSDVAEERRKEDTVKKSQANRTKIIIKNLPFQASRKDIRSLFAQYGQLKTVRVPRKFDSTSRGFGFAEFVTAKEAQSAMDALSDTHLLGRRLVLEFTQEEEVDPEEQIQAMERKMEQQNNRMQLSKLTGTGRKKFILGAGEEVD